MYIQFFYKIWKKNLNVYVFTTCKFVCNSKTNNKTRHIYGKEYICCQISLDIFQAY